MKKLLALFLLFSVLLTAIGCSSGLDPVRKTVEKTQEKKTETEEETEEPLPTGEIVYPAGFSVGYNRQSIAPEHFPIVTYAYANYVATHNHDPIQLTCTALCDGEKTVLLIGVDIRGVPTGFVDYCTKLIDQKFGIPKEQIFMNATHAHSCPDNSHFGEGETMKLWQKMFYERLIRAVTFALHDLTPAEAFAGTGHTEGITFVRRYLLENGSYKFNPSSVDGPVAHESEADTELRVIRFDRGEEKKDVVLVNYQTHYGGQYPDSVSADFVHPLREQTEKLLDCHFGYLNGASGNLNFISAIKGERKYPTIYEAVPAMVDVIEDAVAKEKPVKAGKIQTEASYYQGRGKSGGTTEVRLYSFGIGDLAFCSAPYEMFDTNAKQIRDASPYPMTFVCAYTNGHMGYCPSALAYTHGAYEVDVSPFAPGSGEEFANELVRLLKLCRERE